MRFFSLVLCCACGRDDGKPADSMDSANEVAPVSDTELAQLDLTRVKADVDLLADDALGGRAPESVGHALARDHIVSELMAIGLEPAGDDGGYTQEFELTSAITRYALDAEGAVVEIAATHGTNIAALLPGADPEHTNEVLVIMSHYDHLGTDINGNIYNGAFDDATGVAAALELARFLAARETPIGRSVLFLITDAEEGGLNGARAWVENPTVPLDDVVLGFSIDPLGRGLLPDYAPLILLGLERCPALQERVRALRAYSDVDVAFVNRDPIPVFASDQDTFYEPEEPIAAFWFVSPGMTWYHTTDDNPDTVDYRSVKSHLRFLAQLVVGLGDDTERYTDGGAQPLSVADAEEAAILVRGTLGSAELTADERATAESLLATFDDTVAAGAVGSDLSGAYLSAAIFLLLDLTEAHPGEVPPPWPE